MQAIALVTKPKGNAMKNVIQAVVAVLIVAATVGNASAQYARWGSGGYTFQPSQTTNFYGPTGNYLGSARTN